MARCNSMPGTYTLTRSGDANGTYSSANNTRNNFYAYYLDGGAQNGLHFTLGATGNGLGDQRAMTNMHITQTLPGTGFNIQRYFNIYGRVTGYNIENIPLSSRLQARELMDESLGMYTSMAREICSYLV